MSKPGGAPRDAQRIQRNFIIRKMLVHVQYITNEELNLQCLNKLLMLHSCQGGHWLGQTRQKLFFSKLRKILLCLIDLYVYPARWMLRMDCYKCLTVFFSGGGGGFVQEEISGVCLHVLLFTTVLNWSACGLNINIYFKTGLVYLGLLASPVIAFVSLLPFLSVLLCMVWWKWCTHVHRITCMWSDCSLRMRDIILTPACLSSQRLGWLSGWRSGILSLHSTSTFRGPRFESHRGHYVDGFSIASWFCLGFFFLHNL